MKELERVEAQALRDAVLLGGGRAELIAGALCVSHPDTPIPELNRAIPLGEVVDAGGIHGFFEGRPHVVALPPGYLGLDQSLAALGYTPGYAWMKFSRDASPVPAAATDLRVEETLDVDAFALACGEGSGMPLALARQLAGIVGAPGWHCFVAFAGAEPAACGALYADGEYGWLGVGATRPSFRGRGAHNAILAARLEAGRALGVQRFTTETGEQVEGRPDQSYRNILRAGFHEAYLRPNWRSPE